MKKCNTCRNEIPKSRKSTATHCSDACYYTAKKARSKRRYATIKAPDTEIKRCEHILAHLFEVSTTLKKSVNIHDLETYKFNFGISTGEHKDEKKGICKIVGKYAYYIHPDKNLTIWKLK